MSKSIGDALVIVCAVVLVACVAATLTVLLVDITSSDPRWPEHENGTVCEKTASGWTCIGRPPVESRDH